MDCQWEAWAAWSSCGIACSAADGTGHQTRVRTSTPATNGGNACSVADGSDTQSCRVECPGKRIIYEFGYLANEPGIILMTRIEVTSSS